MALATDAFVYVLVEAGPLCGSNQLSILLTTIMSDLTTNQSTPTFEDGTPILPNQTSLAAEEASSAGSAASETPPDAQEPLRSMGGRTPFTVSSHLVKFDPVTEVIITRYLRDPTASYLTLINNAYTTCYMKHNYMNAHDVLTEAGTVVTPSILESSSRQGPSAALDPRVVTESVAMESVLSSKLFDEKSRRTVEKARVLSEAVKTLLSALESGRGTSLGSTMHFLFTGMATHWRCMDDMEQYAPKFCTAKKETFQESWKSNAAFNIWTSIGWGDTSSINYIELTDSLIKQPRHAAVWVLANSMRRTPFEQVVIYDSGRDTETLPLNYVGRDTADSDDDREWIADFNEAKDELLSGDGLSPATRKAVGEVTRWAQHLLAGSGSTTGAFILMALANYQTFECPAGNLPLNYHNSIVGTETILGPERNPLVTWALQHKMVTLDAADEPYPQSITPQNVGSIATVVSVALRAGFETRMSNGGLDIFYTIHGLQSPPGEIATHHEQLAAAKRDMILSELQGTGIDMVSTVGDEMNAGNKAVIKDLQSHRCVPANTIPIWLVSTLSGQEGLYPVVDEVKVKRELPPEVKDYKNVDGTRPDCMVTRLSGRIFWTDGPSVRAHQAQPEVHVVSRGRFVKPVQIESPVLFHTPHLQTIGTMFVIPTKTLFNSQLDMFAETPFDCSGSMITPLTHLRVPVGVVRPEHRKMVSLGAAVDDLTDAFRR
jgi:hypothetical protein